MLGNGLPLPTLILTVLAFSFFLSPTSTLGQKKPPAKPNAAQQKANVAARKYSIAHGCMAKRLYPEAVRRFQEFIKQYPKNAKVVNAYHHLGVCQIQTRDYKGSATTFRTTRLDTA